MSKECHRGKEQLIHHYYKFTVVNQEKERDIFYDLARLLIFCLFLTKDRLQIAALLCFKEPK